jgi:hypothetical protein
MSNVRALACIRRVRSQNLNTVTIARRLFQLLLLAALSSQGAAQAAENFVAIRLPKGVAVELPRNWSTLSDNQRITLDTWVQVKTESFTTEPLTSELSFAANYYDDKSLTAAIFNVRYYRAQELTQDDARQASSADVKELDEVLRQSVVPGVEASGNRLLVWRGTKRVDINGATAFVSEYRRSTPQGGAFRAQLVRVFNGPKTFTVTVSYREDQAFFLSPICDRVIRSIRIQ